MASPWRDYQEQAAEFFRSLGLAADVEAPTEGARGKHKVDVCVRFERFGVSQLWIVECKLWNAPVKKENVLVLDGVVKDVGADRGFLLSESGFQGGAVTAARRMNITLTSIAELSEAAAEDLDQLHWDRLFVRVADAGASLGNFVIHEVHATGGGARLKPGMNGDEYWRWLGAQSLLATGLERARTGRFPAPYAFSDDGQRVHGADTMSEVLAAAENVLAELEMWVACEKERPWSMS